MPREDRILSQSEIDSLLKKIAPKTDEPAAKEEPASSEPVEPEVKPEMTPSEAPQNLHTVSFKATESTESEESAPAGMETDSMKMSEHKPKAAETPPSVEPMEIEVKKSAPIDANDSEKKIAELTSEVKKLSSAVQAITQLEEKVKQLEAAMKNMPDSTPNLKHRIDKIAAAIEAGEANKSDFDFLEAFICSHCHSKGNVAIYTKCTKCGKENWIGWWPEKK
jgi:outer membrane murein-binding lipoprotein Lpp